MSTESPTPTVAAGCVDIVRETGFCFVHGDRMREAITAVGTLQDWPAFSASWADLGPDTYLAQTGRARRRRHGVFSWRAGELHREPHQPHYQAVAYNTLQGGLERWFEPIADDIANGASMRTLVSFACRFFGALAPAVATWRIEVHQFRIEAQPGMPGEPTPEGVHRDGVDYVLVAMVDRCNIASGTTTIHSLDGELLGSFTLVDALDAALVDDARVFHGVTPVEALDPSQPAHRDVLVVTLKRSD